MPNMNFGISSEDLMKSAELLMQEIKNMIELYLTEDEIKELNNSKTSKRRKKKLIELSNWRMMAYSSLKEEE